MSIEVTMPQLGESVVEGAIAKWLVSEGDSVQEDQALVEVTTDKIDTEIPSPAAGVVARILVPAGVTVKVGTALCEIEEGAGRVPAARERASRETSAAAAPPAARSEPRAASPAPEPAGSQAAPGPSASRAAPAGGAARPAAAAPHPATPVSPATTAGGRSAPAAARGAAPSPQPSGLAAQPSRRSVSSREGVALDERRLDEARERRAAIPRDGRGGDGRASGSRRVTPVVRKMAADHDVDLARVTGTGVGGRVTKQDLLDHLRRAGRELPVPEPGYGDLLGFEGPAPEVRARAAKPTAASLREAGRAGMPSAAVGRAAVRPGMEPREYAPPVVEPGEGDVVEPFSRRRKIIAEHMVYSKAVSAHVYTMAEIDMAGVAALRERHKRRFQQEEGVPLTYLHFVIAATVRALREVPRLNAVVGEDALILRRDVNIGVAVETEQGLVVPVVRNADRLSLRGIARAVEEIAVKARERRLRVEDLQGGTFTISNPGREGNLVGFAVINQPQLGILRMGEIRKRPVVVEVDGADAITIRHILLLSLSYDHRVIDGVTGNSFLYRVKGHLERADFEL